MKKYFTLIFLLGFISMSVEAQKFYDDFDPNVSFGIQINTIFPTELLNVREAFLLQGDVEYGVDPVNGFSYGGVVNFRLSRRFYILTGINMLRRNYNAYQIKEGVRTDVRFRTMTFEIPIMASYYIRLSDNLLLNVASGMPVHFTPTDLFARRDDLEALSIKLGWMKPVISNTVGMEWRTEFSGGIYLGAVYNIAPWPLFVTRIGERNVPFADGAFLEQIGDFFGIVARYYLP